ncbi:hypothetical protein H312_00991 [Anncaliia algerae PRA339]|uniref:Uncharacterized protein n=1 Tax=Anncaliia algerae PRA339 TaxID=1288291 RepID=A0A059F2S2_9MICR|nr:hypothetical protein H312_00991 [Anncaliia algerae PRA339]
MFIKNDDKLRRKKLDGYNKTVQMDKIMLTMKKTQIEAEVLKTKVMSYPWWNQKTKFLNDLLIKANISDIILSIIQEGFSKCMIYTHKQKSYQILSELGFIDKSSCHK